MPKQARSAERPCEPQANDLTDLLNFFLQVGIGCRGQLFDEVNISAKIISLDSVRRWLALP